MTSSALAGLPPLPKSLSGMLNPGDSLSGSPQGSAFRPVGGGGGGGRQSAGQSLYANARPRSQERSASTSSTTGMYVNTAEVRAASYSPSGGRKWTQLDSQLAFLRQEMVSLRQMDMDLLCKFWALNEKIQEYKAQQSRNSSLSPHDWLEQDEHEEESDEEYFNDPEDIYIQPYRNGQSGANNSTNYRNGHSASRLKPLHEPDFGSNSSLEYGDI